MIDIHSHILPGIDDGALDFDSSIEMLRVAEKSGVSDIILTPHYIRGSIYNADNAKKWKLLSELRERAASEGISVNLYLGNEVYIDTELPKMVAAYENEKSELMYEIATLNSTKYILVEFPVQVEDKTARETLFSLVQHGFVPVIAHPERYVYIQNNLTAVDELIGMGCVLQGDYLAVLGRYGRRAEKTLRELLIHDKIFCLASDIHKATDEYKFNETKAKMYKILKASDGVKAGMTPGAKLKELFEDNPKKILLGE
ncbi:hypothetical protein IJG91_03340 [Candidatus Saccharibacteria bacterium]|nr:hypothetical protein [Candidatus Saccharibacteria bacterium]